MTDIDEQREAIREEVAAACYRTALDATERWGELPEWKQQYWREHADRLSGMYADHGAVLKVEVPEERRHLHEIRHGTLTDTAPLVAPEGQQDSEVPGPEPAGPRG